MIPFACTSPAMAQFGGEGGPAKSSDSGDAKRKENKAAAMLDYEANRKKHEGDADKLVLPGLLADRKTKSVRVWAEAVGLDGEKPVEFFLIPDSSGKDYEALAVTYALPSDIHKAMEFIGMKPGRPVNFEKLEFWPKGERVAMWVDWQEPPPADKKNASPASKRARIEDLIFDKRTKKPLARSGLVFAGSYWRKTEGGDTPQYAADVSESRSIASNYNEPTTVFDLPRQAGQGEVYASQIPNPELQLKPGQRLTITIEPESKDGKARVRDLTLRAFAKPGTGADAIRDALFTIEDATGKKLIDGQSIIHAVAALGEIVDAGQDPFVSLRVDDAVTAKCAAQISLLMRGLERERGIRIDPPEKGHPPHVAFLPAREWYEPSNRPGTRLEITLIRNDGKTTASGRQLTEKWDNELKSRTEEKTTPVETPAQLAELLKGVERRWTRDVFVMCPGELHYGDLAVWTRPLMEAGFAVYIVLPENARPR